MLTKHIIYAPDGSQVQILERSPDFEPDPNLRFHVVTCGRNLPSLEVCQQYIDTHWDSDDDCAYPWPDPVYQAGMMYAAGYHD